MATKKRSGLGRGIGALIPQSPSEGERPVDVFFPSAPTAGATRETAGGVHAAADDLVAVPGAELRSLQVTDIVPNQSQPRTEFDEDQLAELVESIREVGLLQPIVVRSIPAGVPQEIEDVLRGQGGLTGAGRGLDHRRTPGAQGGQQVTATGGEREVNHGHQGRSRPGPEHRPGRRHCMCAGIRLAFHESGTEGGRRHRRDH